MTFEVFAKAFLLRHKNQDFLLKTLQASFREAGQVVDVETREFLKNLCEGVDPVIQLPPDSLWMKVIPSLSSTVRVQVEYQGQESRLFLAFALRCFANRRAKELFPLLERGLEGREWNFCLKFSSYTSPHTFEMHELNIYNLYFLTYPEDFSDREEGLLQALTPFVTNCSPHPVKPLDIVLQDQRINPFNEKMYLFLREVCFEFHKARCNASNLREILEGYLFEARTLKSLLPCQKIWMEKIYRESPQNFQRELLFSIQLHIPREPYLPYEDYLIITAKQLPKISQLPQDLPPRPSCPFVTEREHELSTHDLNEKFASLFQLSIGYEVSGLLYKFNERETYNEAYTSLLMQASFDTPLGSFLFMLMGKQAAVAAIEKGTFLKNLYPQLEGDFTLQVYLEKEGIHILHEVLTYFVYEVVAQRSPEVLMEAFFSKTQTAAFFRIRLQSIKDPSQAVEIAHLNPFSFYLLFQQPGEAWLTGESGLLRILASLFPIECIHKGESKCICPLTKSEIFVNKNDENTLHHYLAAGNTLSLAFLRNLSPQASPGLKKMEEILNQEPDDSKSKLPLTVYESLLSNRFLQKATLLGQPI